MLNGKSGVKKLMMKTNLQKFCSYTIGSKIFPIWLRRIKQRQTNTMLTASSYAADVLDCAISDYNFAHPYYTVSFDYFQWRKIRDGIVVLAMRLP